MQAVFYVEGGRIAPSGKEKLQLIAPWREMQKA